MGNASRKKTPGRDAGANDNHGCHFTQAARAVEAKKSARNVVTAAGNGKTAEVVKLRDGGDIRKGPPERDSRVRITKCESWEASVVAAECLPKFLPGIRFRP